jgi:hypothetical protein
MDPINPGHQICASCHYWTPGGDNPEWCHAAMGYTDPAFTCQDWQDLRGRTDPATGEKWPELEAPPLRKP